MAGQFENTIQRGAALVSPRPLDTVTGGGRGTYSLGVNTGEMAAGMAAASEVFQFRNASATLTCLVRRIRVAATSSVTGFTAGLVLVDAIAARAYTAAGSGGSAPTLTTNNAKRFTDMGTCAAVVRVSTTAALTAGTETLDANAFAAVHTSVGTAAYTPFPGLTGPTDLFYARSDEYPMRFAQNEGFVIRVTVPATGTWKAAINVDWDEIPLGLGY